MEKPYVTVIIPAYQEEKALRGNLEIIIAYLQKQNYTSEIIVVDDGSQDRTASIVQECANTMPALRLLRFEVNRGKGAAIREGMKSARGQFVLFTDADNSTPIEEMAKLLEEAQRGCDIVMGSRYLPSSVIVVKQNIIRRFMSRAGNTLFRLVLGLPYADTRCGFKIYSEHARAILFPRQTLQRWGFDTELLVIARIHALLVKEVPVRWTDRADGRPQPLRDSMRSLQEIFHILRNKRRGAYH